MAIVKHIEETLRARITDVLALDGHDLEAWTTDLAMFKGLALSGKTFKECYSKIGRTEREARKYYLKKLYDIYNDLYKGQVAENIYDKAILENDFPAQKFIAETQMGWTKTEKQDIKVSGQDDWVLSLRNAAKSEPDA